MRSRRLSLASTRDSNMSSVSILQGIKGRK
jgi:hypothetical protein